MSMFSAPAYWKNNCERLRALRDLHGLCDARAVRPGRAVRDRPRVEDRVRRRAAHLEPARARRSQERATLTLERCTRRATSNAS